MATAGQLRQEFQQYLDQKGCRYTVVDESDNIVRIGFAASSHMEDGGHRTRIYVDFDEEPDVDGIPCVHFVSGLRQLHGRERAGSAREAQRAQQALPLGQVLA